MLYQHDPAQSIGVWDEIREDAHGLYARGHLIAGKSCADKIIAMIQEGTIDGLSIGFATLHAQQNLRTRGRFLYDIDLWEISIVMFPMLADARISQQSPTQPITRP